MKKGILFGFFALLFLPAFSQSDSDTTGFNPHFGLLTYIGIGASYNNYKNLNATLQNNNLPTVGKFGLAEILGEDFRLHNWLIGLNENVTFSQKRPDNYNVWLMTFSGEINGGYYLINSKQFHFAPMAGIGYYGAQARLTQRGGFSNFNEVLQNKNSIDINQSLAALDFQLRFDFADFTKRHDDFTSIKLGYRYGLKQQGWGIDEANYTTVADSPKDRVNQFYILICTGLSRAERR